LHTSELKKKHSQNNIEHSYVTGGVSMFFTSSIYCWPLLQWFQTWGTCTPMQRYYTGGIWQKVEGENHQWLDLLKCYSKTHSIR